MPFKTKWLRWSKAPNAYRDFVVVATNRKIGVCVLIWDGYRRPKRLVHKAQLRIFRNK